MATDAQKLAAAKAIRERFIHRQGQSTRELRPWESLPQRIRDGYLDEASAALEAAEKEGWGR